MGVPASEHFSCRCRAGEEISFNYNFNNVGEGRSACHCGATNCSGWLGLKPREAPKGVAADAAATAAALAAANGGVVAPMETEVGSEGSGEVEEGAREKRQTKSYSRRMVEDECYR